MGNPIVFIDGMPGINLTCPTTGNSMNNGLGAALVPSATTVTFCDASRSTTGTGCGTDAWPRWPRLGAHGIALAWAPGPEPTGPTVTHVRRGSLGFRLGVRAGDRLEALHGLPLATRPPDEVLELLEQAPGGTFRAVVARAAGPMALELACAPSDEDSQLVQVAMLPEAVGYLAVHAFTSELPALARDALDRLARAAASSLVLDLRGNPGGELEAVLFLAGEFLAPGTVVVRLHHMAGHEVAHRVHGLAPRAWPLVVLIDRGTASAAEFLAGALQCHRRAIVVGERTYGKGLAIELAVDPVTHQPRRATRAEGRLPDGKVVQGAGIQPDVELSPPLKRAAP
jgi:C-terminal peptidase prc